MSDKKKLNKRGGIHGRPDVWAHRRCNRTRIRQLRAFVAALGIVLVWATSGPLFHFNDTWQLVINTGTTIVTFLMVFLIQHTQNADTAALHIKLDELIRVSKGANQELLNLESMDPAHLEEIRQRYEALARTAADIKSKKERCMPDSRSASSEPSDKAEAESGNLSRE